MFDKLSINKFTTKSVSKNKKQIILCNSFRNYSDYINGLKFRFNGKYSKLPHYIVTKDGKVLNFMDDKKYSDFFESLSINRNSIIVVLENLGWLEKIPLTNHYLNWIGDIYKEEVYERKWRDYFFWEPYPEEQIKKTAELCKFLLDKHKITNRCIGHNTKINGIENFSGILSKSNIHEDYTDLSPAFDFELFEKFLENESIR
jgi:N-acetyl-anhydromuramyl-L-alanine amidase AmpD